MRRLVWVGVGVVATVLVVRKGRQLVDAYVPAGTTDAVQGVGRFMTAVRTAQHEFRTGMAEREEQLRHDLVGDADVEALRAQRPERVADLRRTWGARRAREDWTGPTEDPDDDDGYAFF